MVNVTARLRIKGKSFEVLVDVDKALQLRQGKPVNMQNVLAFDSIFYDMKKGNKASESDLQANFNTGDIYVIAEKIIKSGELEVPSEYKAKEKEDKVKQAVDWLSKNCQDPKTGKPHTALRIEQALKEAGINIDNRPIEEQISKILEKLRVIIPIKIETKKLKVRVPSLHTGRAYGLFAEYKEKEEWLNNGDLEVTINLPVGMQMIFYDKLNGITHGSAIVEEIK
jgi:rRNA metabolism SBDS family protein